jgi:L-asparaginase
LCKEDEIVKHFYCGESKSPIIILHGGAGPQDPKTEIVEQTTKDLVDFANSSLKNTGDGAMSVVAEALLLLEKSSCFNAGYGSALQADGVARLSASIMSGDTQKFSAVASVPYLTHPSKLAITLQDKRSRVLTIPGAELLARELGLEVSSSLDERRVETWVQKLKDSVDMGDTVGCVYWHNNSQLIAGSSTGGRGFERPGRISDSATVAGNYCSKFLAVTATGIGEEIVDDAVCAKLETRVRDGMSLKEAAAKTFEEALEKKRQYGWIAIDQEGNWNVAFTSKGMSFAVCTADDTILSWAQVAGKID